MESRSIETKQRVQGIDMVTRLIIIVAGKLKPLLLKIFPKRLLSAVKRKAMSGVFKEIEEYQLLPYERGRFSYGINLIGNIKAETGLGQSCRLVANLLEQSEIPFGIYFYDSLSGTNNADTTWNSRIVNELSYGINLVHINPAELGAAYTKLDKKIWENHYNIAFWLWELEEFPDEWVPCFYLFHEIWTPSEFISEALRKKTDKPVKTMPYHVTAEVDENCSREFFGLPEDKFLFLMMYDSASVMERKNPMGVINAFKTAFSSEDDSVGLVIKMKSNSLEEEKMLQNELQGYKNVYFVKDVLTKPQVGSLLKSVDVFVSLHRAEGFGLVMAEAMLLGTPVIATNWSANTEFMNNEVACMVDYKLVQLEKDYGPFKKGQRWAEPDLEQAAEYMKELYQYKDVYIKYATNGKKCTGDKLSKESASELVMSRMNELR